MNKEDVERRIMKEESASSAILANIAGNTPYSEWDPLLRKVFLMALWVNPTYGNSIEVAKARSVAAHLFYRPWSNPDFRELLEEAKTLSPDDRRGFETFAEHLRPRLLRTRKWTFLRSPGSRSGIELARTERESLEKRGDGS